MIAKSARPLDSLTRGNTLVLHKCVAVAFIGCIVCALGAIVLGIATNSLAVYLSADFLTTFVSLIGLVCYKVANTQIWTRRTKSLAICALTGQLAWVLFLCYHLLIHKIEDAGGFVVLAIMFSSVVQCAQASLAISSWNDVLNTASAKVDDTRMTLAIALVSLMFAGILISGLLMQWFLYKQLMTVVSSTIVCYSVTRTLRLSARIDASWCRQ